MFVYECSFHLLSLKKCLGVAWYLNVDMQFSLLAPLVLIPLMKWPRYALGAIGLLTLASMAACFGVTYHLRRKIAVEI